MAEVYVVMRRTDIPEGTLQMLDLWPNTSQRNAVLTPPRGQTGYVRNIPLPLIASSVSAGPPVLATAELHGVASYLVGNIDTGAGAGGAPFTGAEADLAADGLRLIAQAGTVLDLAAVNAVLAGVVAGTTLTAGGSTGTLAGLLATMAGRDWVIPTGSALSDGAGAFAGSVGAAEATITEFTQLYNTGYFLISNGQGMIHRMKRADFTYRGVQGPAVVVYSAAGALL